MFEILNGGGSRALREITWIADRHEKYCLFIGRVHKVIVAVIQAEKTERQRRKVIQKIIEGYDADKEVKVDVRSAGTRPSLPAEYS